MEQEPPACLSSPRAISQPWWPTTPSAWPAWGPRTCRVASLSDGIGYRGLLVHSESEQARGFYEHLIPEFERSPTDSLHLLLLLKDIRRTLGSINTSGQQADTPEV